MVLEGENMMPLPLLEPSSPRITFIEDIICCAAGGDIDVAYR